MYLVKAFTESLSTAITLYEERFKRKKAKIPEHRLFDIIELRALLEENEYTIEEIYNHTHTIISSMKTGLIIGNEEIIKTGRSRLKDHLHQVLDRPRYTLEKLLSDEAHSRHVTMQNQQQPSTSSEEWTLLQQKLQIQHSIIEEQAKQLELLQQANTSLAQKNKALHDDITALQSRLENLQQTNTNLAQALTVVESPSAGNPFNDAPIDAATPCAKNVQTHAFFTPLPST